MQAFYDAGCRYLQMDDIFFAYLCDPTHREQKKAEGHDPDWLITQYAKMMHDAIADRPEDMIIAMHLCRGNFQSKWAAEGAYDPAADAVFNQTGVDVYFMEYDSERAGGLEPLRLLPKGKKRVLPGFITTKTGELESLDDLKRRFEEHWLQQANRIGKVTLALLQDENAGGFFATVPDATAAVISPRKPLESNGTAASFYYDLWVYTKDDHYKSVSENAIRGVAQPSIIRR